MRIPGPPEYTRLPEIPRIPTNGERVFESLKEALTSGGPETIEYHAPSGQVFTVHTIRPVGTEVLELFGNDAAGEDVCILVAAVTVQLVTRAEKAGES